MIIIFINFIQCHREIILFSASLKIFSEHDDVHQLNTRDNVNVNYLIYDNLTFK